MPPKAKKKDGASKKAEQKKKEKIIEDKTFGLKNKNKSSKVQAKIKSVERNVLNSGDPKMRKLEEERKQAKLAAKARKLAEKQERDALFGEALLAVSKKKSVGTNAGKVEAKGRDGEDEATKKAGTSRAMKMMYQMDAKEMDEKLKEDPNYVPTLEDEVEMQRQKLVDDLKKSGKKGTPVTEQSLAEWLERKRKRRLAEAKKKVEAEMRKKKGGKGLAVLSGRELYDYNKELFTKGDQDDDANTAANGNAAGAEESATENGSGAVTTAVDAVAEKVETDLFLEGDDDDLDDIDDDDDDLPN